MKHLKKFNEAFVSDSGLEDFEIPSCLTDDPDDDPDEAYEKGREARSKGYGKDENPYDVPDLMDAWDEGFDNR